MLQNPTNPNKIFKTQLDPIKSNKIRKNQTKLTNPHKIELNTIESKNRCMPIFRFTGFYSKKSKTGMLVFGFIQIESKIRHAYFGFNSNESKTVSTDFWIQLNPMESKIYTPILYSIQMNPNRHAILDSVQMNSIHFDSNDFSSVLFKLSMFYQI